MIRHRSLDPMLWRPFAPLLLAAALLLPSPAVAGPAGYTLFFVPPTPLPPTVDETVGVINIGVDLQGACPGPYTPVTWDISLVPSGASPADATDFGPPSPDSLTFSSTQPTQIFTIPVNVDAVPEGPETFDIRLTPSAGSPDLDCEAPAQKPAALEFGLTVTIVEGGAATHDVAILDAFATESAGSIFFDVSLSQANPGPDNLTVDWFTADNSALAGQDYLAASGQVVFLPGDSAKQIQIDVIDDALFEPQETFFVTLTNPSLGLNLLDGQAEGTIQDDDSMGTVDILMGDATALETAPEMTFGIFLSIANPGPGNITVDWATRDGTAIAGQDYVAASGQASFMPGETTVQVPINMIDDNDAEGIHDFFIDLSNPMGSGAVAIADAVGQGIIQDDETPSTIDISIDDASAAENLPEMVFDIRLSAPNPGPGPITVDWASRDGTAVAGANYVAASGQASFMQGESLTQISIDLIDNADADGNLDFFVDLSNSMPAIPQLTILDAEATGTIQDDEQPPAAGLAIDSVTVTEGDDGNVDAVFTVTLGAANGLQKGPASSVMVNFATVDGSATVADNDYLPTSGQLSFAAGETSKTITVSVVGDGRDEADEAFFVDLSAADGAVIDQARGRCDIVDDDAAALPSISISDASVNEGNSGTRTATFTLNLSQAGNGSVTVDVATADGAATAGEDYRATSGTVTFAPGQTSQSFGVEVLGDTQIEPDERFTVSLSNPSGATLGRATGRGTIVNDDSAEPASTLRFVRGAQSVMEGGGTAQIVVARAGGTAGAAQVTYSTASGTARAGQDFGERRGVLRWRNGEGGTKSFTVAINDDNVREPDETFSVRLSEPTGASLGTPSEARVAIVDDDTPIRLEAVGEQEVTLRVSEEAELQVRVSRMDGSAVAAAPVGWAAQGRVEILGAQETLSDVEGVATLRVRASSMPGMATVVARLPGTESAVSFAVMVEGNLRDLGGGGGDDDMGDDEDIAGALDQGCATATGELLATCEFLFGISDPTERQQALEALTPRNAVAQGNAALRAPRVQLRNIGSRLGALRGGSTRLADADQLSFGIQGDSVAVSTLRSAVSGTRFDESDLAEKLDDALHGRVRGGAASADAIDPDEPETELPWGFFVNGRVSFGDAPQTGRETGYDFDTQGITAGVDRRLGSKWVVGASVGYLGTEVDQTRDSGQMEISGTSLSLYGTYFSQRFYVDAIVGYGWNEYQLDRVINLPRQFRGQSRLVARGEPDGTQLSVDLGAGYDFALGAANLGGFVRVSYIDAEIDAFLERGAGPLDLGYASQSVESLQGEAGFELSYPWSLRWGVVQPSLRVSYLHEFSDDQRIIRAFFREDPRTRRFAVVTDTPDRDFFNVGAGVTVTLPRSMATYLIFDTDLEREDLDIYTLSGGFRFQF